MWQIETLKRLLKRKEMLEKGKTYEVCVVCGELFEVTEEVAVFHGSPEENNPAEGPWVGPHWHVFLPVCPACRAKKGR